MASTEWDRRSFAVRDRERDRLLSEWLRGEVIPFSRFWGERLAGASVRNTADLAGVPVADEDELAPAGGAGNPALLMLPTEEQFKRHASRAELLAAAREVTGGGGDGRRLALFRRYKPVHVHEAGVARLLTIAYTRSDLDRLHLAGSRLAEIAGLGTDDSLVNAVPPGPSLRFWGIYHLGLAARMTALHPRTGPELPVGPVTRAFAVLPATVLAVPVGEAVDLLRGMARRNASADRLRTILTVGPPPDADARGAIADAGGSLAGNAVRVQAVWAPEPARALWGECRPPDADPVEATFGLHTYPDLEHVEVRDVEAGHGSGPNEPGELVYTSLGWRGTVLVRAATGAWTGGLVDTVACPNCERTVPRLAPEAREAAWQPRVRDDRGASVRVDLRRAPSVLSAAKLEELGVRDWSLAAEGHDLVLGLDLPGHGDDGVAELAREVGEAVGVVPHVRLGAEPAGQRPRLRVSG
jgi:hypothetical protein